MRCADDERFMEEAVVVEMGVVVGGGSGWDGSAGDNGGGGRGGSRAGGDGSPMANLVEHVLKPDLHQIYECSCFLKWRQ